MGFGVEGPCGLHRMSPAPVLVALADPVRTAIVERLVRGGPASVSQLAIGLPVTRQAVTKHLRVLHEAGVVKSERKGREQVCELKPESLEAASQWLEKLASDWDERLARLKR